MTLSKWRNVLHKFIVAVGFMALIAIVTGARVGSSMEGPILAEDIFNKRQSPSPTWIGQCENKSWLERVLFSSQRDEQDDICIAKEMSPKKRNAVSRTL